MPAYNCEAYIEQTIRAVIDQTHKDWELFVVNDCSTDNTGAVIMRMTDSRVHILNNGKNLGCDNSRNAAIKKILQRKDDFDYVAFCDGDDVWNPGHLSDALNTLRKGDMYYSDVTFQNSRNEPIEVFGIPRPSNFDRGLLLKQNYIFVSTVVMSTKCVQMFDKLCDPKGDWDMWLRVSSEYTVVQSNFKGAIYRWKNEGSYYTEEESSASKLRVELKHGIYSDDADLSAKIQLGENLEKEYAVRRDYETAARLREYTAKLQGLSIGEVYEEPKRVVKYVVAVHPYSHKLPNGKTNPKNYPYWKQLVEALKSRGFYIIQVGIAGEEPVGADEMIFNASNERLKEVLDRCDTFICVDSFFQHFAHYHGRNGVVIFGPSDPKIFGYRDNFNVFKDRKYFRPNQFSTWMESEYSEEVFAHPGIIVEIVTSMVSSINSVPAN